MTEPERTMITFRHGNMRFTYRLAGIATREGHVLLQRAENMDIWFLPGGRAELGETAEDGLRREMREELNADVHVERLAFVIENFFRMGERIYHELGLYFLISLPDEATMSNIQQTLHGIDANIPFIFQWLPLQSLPALTVYPECLQHLLQNIPATTQHIVNYEL